MQIKNQEAQLSQSGRAVLCTTEYFTKSLKIIWNNTPDYGMCKSLLAFHCNYISILYRFWDSQHQIMAWPWNHSTSLEMASFDRSYTSS